MKPLRWLLALSLLAVFAFACSAKADAPSEPTAVPSATEPAATATAAPTATPVRVREDVIASRLRVPALGIDASVSKAEIIPDTSTALPGCPERPPGEQTLTVPNQGLATPGEVVDGLENKSWIFGHSRWLGVPGLFFRLEDLNPGDELFLDGTDLLSGKAVANERYVVKDLYLSDTDSGDDVITAPTPADIPLKPQLILQTSVREDGAGKQWILNQQKLLSKAKNVVPGDLNDPCKYLILFVIAEQS